MDKTHLSKHLGMFCRLAYSLVLLAFIQFIEKTNGQGMFPTYEHPFYKGQLCYKCPPGYFLEADCKFSRDGQPQWPTCTPCPESQFSQRWNTDGRCWDHAICEDGHVEIYNGQNVGPVKCSCKSSEMEIDGECVRAIPRKNHENLIAREKSECKTRVHNIKSAQEATSRPNYTEHPCTETICPECTKEKMDKTPFIIVLIIAIASAGVILVVIVCHLIRAKAFGRLTLLKEKDPMSSRHEGEESRGLRPLCHDSESGSPTLFLLENTTQAHHPPPKVSPAQYVELPESHDLPKISKDAETALATEYVHVADVPAGKNISFPDALIYESDMDALDTACRVIENRVVLHKDADEFMRYILNLHADECEIIKTIANEAKQQVRNAFRVWKRKEGRKATVENLLQSLQSNSWQLHAEKIAEALDIELPGARKKDSDEQRFDKASQICERKMKTNTDKDFIRWNLGLGSDDISGLIPGEKNFIREGLSKWRKREGTAATAEELVRQLYKAKILDVAEEICTELNIERPDVDDDDEKSMSEHANLLQEEEVHDDKAGPDMQEGVIREMSQPESYSSEQASQSASQQSTTTSLNHGPRQRSNESRSNRGGAEQTNQGRPGARVISDRDDDQPGTSNQHARKGTVESDSQPSNEYNKAKDAEEREDIDHFEDDPGGYGGKAFRTDGRQDEDKWKTKDSISDDLLSQKHRKKSNSKKRSGHHDSDEFLKLNNKATQEKSTERTSDV